MTEIAELSELDKALQTMTGIKMLTDFLGRLDKDARKTAESLMKKGDTLAVRSLVDDTKMSRVNLSDPKSVAQVTDPAALDEWIRETYPDKLKTEETVIATDDQVKAILREHPKSRELLASVTFVPDWLLKNLVDLATGQGKPVDLEKRAGEHAPPGITVSKPDPKLSLTVDRKTGPAAFREMWNAGLYGGSGGLLALTEGEQ